MQYDMNNLLPLLTYDNAAYLPAIPRPSPLGDDDKNPFGVGFW